MVKFLLIIIQFLKTFLLYADLTKGLALDINTYCAQTIIMRSVFLGYVVRTLTKCFKRPVSLANFNVCSIGRVEKV